MARHPRDNACKLPVGVTIEAKQFLPNALILSGGGARAAYQVGVLTAVGELLPQSHDNPFSIICGTSAGAINAMSLATHAGTYHEAVDNLASLWSELNTENVFYTSARTLTASGLRLVGSLFNQGMARGKSLALLDNQPLREFLSTHIDPSGLDWQLEHGYLDALSITAMSYGSGESVNFFQARGDIDDWRRYRRVGERTELGIEHLMASAAIPGIFPATRLGDDYYADGAVRQVTPISPALHLGADRVMIIGVSGNRNPVHWGARRESQTHPPSIAQVFGQLFNSAFIDGLEGDIERLQRINSLLSTIPEEVRDDEGIALREVETLVISPTEEIDMIAREHVRDMPRTVRFFFGLVGANAKAGGSATASYVLFEKPFIDRLIEMGYKDAMWDREKILDFFGA